MATAQKEFCVPARDAPLFSLSLASFTMQRYSTGEESLVWHSLAYPTSYRFFQGLKAVFILSSTTHIARGSLSQVSIVSMPQLDNFRDGIYICTHFRSSSLPLQVSAHTAASNCTERVLYTRLLCFPLHLFLVHDGRSLCYRWAPNTTIHAPLISKILRFLHFTVASLHFLKPVTPWETRTSMTTVDSPLLIWLITMAWPSVYNTLVTIFTVYMSSSFISSIGSGYCALDSMYY